MHFPKGPYPTPVPGGQEAFRCRQVRPRSTPLTPSSTINPLSEDTDAAPTNQSKIVFQTDKHARAGTCLHASECFILIQFVLLMMSAFQMETKIFTLDSDIFLSVLQFFYLLQLYRILDLSFRNQI